MTVFPHDKAVRMAVVPVGTPRVEACEVVAETLRETFEAPVSVAPSVDPPSDLESEDFSLEEWLTSLDSYEDEADLIVGVSDAQVQSPDSWQRSRRWVVSDGGQRGVLSTALTGEGELTATDRERLSKLTLTVAGGLFGLFMIHREGESAPCVLDAKDAYRHEDIDDVPDTYCEDCWRALTDAESYPKPPEPDGWFVRSRDFEAFQTAIRWESGETTWRDYPIIALGFLVVALQSVWKRIRSILPSRSLSARDFPEFVHELYRTARFWGNILLYLAAVVVSIWVLGSGYELVAGAEPSDGVTFGLLFGSALVAFPLVWVVKGVFLGLYAAVRGLDPEEVE